LILSLSGLLFSGFWLFWASSGRSKTFNEIMEEIAKSKRKYDKDYTVENVKEIWRIVGFFLLLGFAFALIATISNNEESIALSISHHIRLF